jgi:YidC/Oxa1 family membrane protein insertase
MGPSAALGSRCGASHAAILGAAAATIRCRRSKLAAAPGGHEEFFSRMSDQRNLILAIVLSVGIILAFQYFYEMPRMKEAQQRLEAERAATSETTAPASPEAAPPGVAAPGAAPAPAAPVSRAEELARSPRVPIDNGQLHGSIALKGARIDDVTLANYHETPDPRSPEIVLLSPPGTKEPYFAEFGWVAADAGTKVPDGESLWRAEGGKVGADRPVALSWDNGAGLQFKKTIGLDQNFMFTVKRSIVNGTDRPVTLYPYGLVGRWGTPKTLGYYILHEGPIGVLDGSLNEIKYKKLAEDGPIEQESQGGWLGITDKYWLAALVPQQDLAIKAGFRHQAQGDRYQVDFRGPPMTVPPGGMVEVTDRLFAGAKEVKLLDAYEARYGIPLFDRAVDFGWFYFLTKPIFHVLHFLSRLVGNYGVAILILTLLVKAAFFPLANKSYRAMSQLKKLQPEMTRLRERYGDDKVKLNQELMALYKNQKVNPVSGCLPIVVQIPVFFALYKVLFVSIEMRHAPFFGWIRDLSAPDPTSLFNLFGLIPWSPPHMLMIGVWPIVMGSTMWLQQRLNPQPTDPVQAKVMQFLPVMFTFLFATFPAGLVIYWTWNNILSIAQQWMIMKRMGIEHPAAS